MIFSLHVPRGIAGEKEQSYMKMMWPKARNNEEHLFLAKEHPGKDSWKLLGSHLLIAGIKDTDVAQFCVPRARHKDTAEEHKRTGTIVIRRSRNTKEHKDMKYLLVGIEDTVAERTPRNRTAGAISGTCRWWYNAGRHWFKGILSRRIARNSGYGNYLGSQQPEFRQWRSQN